VAGLRWQGRAHGAARQRALTGRLLGCGPAARRIDGGRGSAAGGLGGPAAGGVRERRLRCGSTAGGLAEGGVRRGPAASRLSGRLGSGPAAGGLGERRLGCGSAAEHLAEERVRHGSAARRLSRSAPGRLGAVPVRVGRGAAAGRLHRRRCPTTCGRRGRRRCGAAAVVSGPHGVLGAVRPRGRLLADRGRRRCRPSPGRGRRRRLISGNGPGDVGAAVLLHQVGHAQATTALSATSTTGLLLFLGFLGTS
jgi:hypothetical protein